MSRRIFSIVFAVLFSLVGSHGVGIAAASITLEDPLARELKQTGDTLMLKGDYEQALDAYERATAIEQHPSLLYNRARALQALNRFSESLEHFEAFRDQAPPELLELVPQLGEMIQSVQEHVTTVQFQLSTPEAQVTVRSLEVLEPTTRLHRFNAGTASVSIEVAGFARWKKTYDFRGDDTLTIKPVLVPLPTEGILRVHSKAVAAEVIIDGKSVGMVPVEVRLKAGSHQVMVRHPQYETVTTSAIVEPGQSRLLSIDLKEHPSVLKKWWFWAGVGAATALGTSLAIALTTERSPDKGDIPPGTLSIPLP